MATAWTRPALLLSMVLGVSLLGAAPAVAAGASCSSALGLGEMTKDMRAAEGPRILAEIGGFNAWFAQEFGGIRFGPAAKAHNEGCR